MVKRSLRFGGTTKALRAILDKLEPPAPRPQPFPAPKPIDEPSMVLAKKKRRR
jgi:hypothetical protein